MTRVLFEQPSPEHQARTLQQTRTLLSKLARALSLNVPLRVKQNRGRELPLVPEFTDFLLQNGE